MNMQWAKAQQIGLDGNFLIGEVLHKRSSKITRNIKKIPMPAPHFIECLELSPCLLTLSVKITSNQLCWEEKNPREFINCKISPSS